MSSRGKKKTTMAKLNREARQRQRRDDKQARKQARRDAAAVASPLTFPLDLPPTEIPAGDAPSVDGIDWKDPL
jgi:hypothetical protein